MADPVGAYCVPSVPADPLRSSEILNQNIQGNLLPLLSLGTSAPPRPGPPGARRPPRRAPRRRVSRAASGNLVSSLKKSVRTDAVRLADQVSARSRKAMAEPRQSHTNHCPRGNRIFLFFSGIDITSASIPPGRLSWFQPPLPCSPHNYNNFFEFPDEPPSRA